MTAGLRGRTTGRALWSGGSFRRLATCMIGFGLIIGIAFPPLMDRTGMMSAGEAADSRFRVACLLAGLAVGALNYQLVRIVVGRRLEFLSRQMSAAVASIEEFQTERDWKRLEHLPCRIDVDTDDELGRPAAAFNTLIGALEANASLQRQLEDQLRHQAFHDPLTGLANRALFLDHTANALARLARGGIEHAMLYLDVDRFKSINDRYGHATGDRVLLEVALRLRSCFRPGDTVARLGGDEFAVLIENVEELDLDALTRRLTRLMAEPTLLDGRILQVSASIGLARATDRDLTPDQLIHAADVAMYAVKTAGREALPAAP